MPQVPGQEQIPRGGARMPDTRRKQTGRGRSALSAPIGCGVDVVELSRFRKAMARGGRAFMRRIFTAQEEAYARARKRTSLLHLAGRFAAKEAVMKALSQLDPGRVLAMNQIEVRNDRWGRPHILLHRSEEHTSELQSQFHLVCRLLLEK